LNNVSHSNSLADVLIEEIESSQWEKKWHSNTVKHSNPNDIDDTCTLEMDNIFASCVQIFVLGHSCLLGVV